MTAETDAPFYRDETVAERDARLTPWLATISPGDIVTVRLNSTDTLTGKVYEAPDARGTSLCLWTTVLRHGNGYPGGSYDLAEHPDETARVERMSDEERVLWSESIPGHRWNASSRLCECGAEVGVVCDPQTVEEHLLAVDHSTRWGHPMSPRDELGDLIPAMARAVAEELAERWEMADG